MANHCTVFECFVYCTYDVRNICCDDVNRNLTFILFLFVSYGLLTKNLSSSFVIILLSQYVYTNPFACFFLHLLFFVKQSCSRSRFTLQPARGVTVCLKCCVVQLAKKVAKRINAHVLVLIFSFTSVENQLQSVGYQVESELLEMKRPVWQPNMDLINYNLFENSGNGSISNTHSANLQDGVDRVLGVVSNRQTVCS